MLILEPVLLSAGDTGRFIIPFSIWILKFRGNKESWFLGSALTLLLNFSRFLTSLCGYLVIHKLSIVGNIKPGFILSYLSLTDVLTYEPQLLQLSNFHLKPTWISKMLIFSMLIILDS